jgi:hypothetical protein
MLWPPYGGASSSSPVGGQAQALSPSGCFPVQSIILKYYADRYRDSEGTTRWKQGSSSLVPGASGSVLKDSTLYGKPVVKRSTCEYMCSNNMRAEIHAANVLHANRASNKYCANVLHANRASNKYCANVLHANRASNKYCANVLHANQGI